MGATKKSPAPTRANTKPVSSTPVSPVTKPTTKQPKAAIRVNAGAIVIHFGGAL